MTSDIDTVTLVHEEHGDGPLAVLIHGITENRHSLDPLIPLLAPHYRVVAVDLRGHGESPFADSYLLPELAADVADVVQGLGGSEPPLVIGHSLGGAVAAVYGAAHPVRGVVIVDQPLDLAGFQAQLRPVEPLLRGDEFESVIRGMFGQMYVSLPPSEVGRLEALRRPDQGVVLGIWDPILTEPLDDLTRAIDAMITATTPYPSLAVHGLPIATDYPEWLGRRIPGTVVEDWGLVGHYPHLVDPERFVARVRAFDAGIGAGS
jgi:pimeloyl-ACP methyl ester carboxylesterase